MMHVDAYLERIAYDGPRDRTAETLIRLHRAHLFTVPFENLDVPLRRPIELSLPALYRKIVERRRGGFCYELNGLFGWLLQELGFELELLSAGVYQEGEPGPDFDHMLLRVEAGGAWLADVGFGDSFLEPLPFADGTTEQPPDAFRVTETDEGWKTERSRRGADWEPQVLFSQEPRRLDDFVPMCRYQQTSAESSFTRKSVCSMATPNGRISLTHDRWIVTEGLHREEQPVDGPEMFVGLLRQHFGVELPEGAEVERILNPRPPEPAEDVTG